MKIFTIYESSKTDFRITRVKADRLSQVRRFAEQKQVHPDTRLTVSISGVVTASKESNAKPWVTL